MQMFTRTSRKENAANLIKVLIEEAGSLSNLARTLNIHKANLSRWANATNDIKPSTVLLIASKINVNERDLERYLDGEVSLEELLQKEKRPSVSHLMRQIKKLDPVERVELFASIAAEISQDLKLVVGGSISQCQDSKINGKTQKMFKPEKLREAIKLTCETREITRQEISEFSGVSEEAIASLLKGDLPENYKEIFEALAAELVKEKTFDSYVAFANREELEKFCGINIGNPADNGANN